VSEPLIDRPDPAKILDAATVYRGPIWDLRSETVEFGASTFTRVFVEHPGAVAVLAIDDEDRVLLINQYRQPIRTRAWEIPAGLLDVGGESPLLAAQRELAEEADVVATEWSDPISLHTSPGGSDEIVHFFEARGLSAAPSVHERSDEETEITVRWVPLDEAVEAVLDGRLHNGVLAFAVLSARARRG
jgi:8-oxo-dGTP pyrophosphatase MutT (NUDIX family)